jgi:putative tryptophan/tyrosine transport system substrate-binding protein
MKRRDFISLIGGAAIAWPLAVRAQQSDRTRRVFVVMGTANDAEAQARAEALHQGLAKSGWIIGRNVRIDTHWAGNKADEVRRRAAELVALAPDVIAPCRSCSQ